ncbi:PepSY-associated TM helix domain-containing protein [Corynebacterium mastitidis]|uniref:PepSY-associated TM helix domain-containing protein n=1 Tax=Corynebacterium mastitidis TaxID=161890 RepID=UPI00255195BB|nr:PepSY domain-containing protein [Corynebacterium mastitidis]MDK8450919.1 PepSY domain-containing protein [Corynebacterium mastitidis]
MRGVVGNAHTLAGLLVVPLILVAALTGLFYAFSPTLEKLAYREELTATSQEPPKPLSEQVAAAQQAYPGLALKGVRASEAPGDTTRVLLADPELGPAKKFSRAVFVDPGSLEIKGDLAQYGTSGSLPLRTWISHGHKELWLGQPGRVYSEVAATWLGPLAVTGVVLFLATRVRNRAPARRGSRRYAKEKHALLGLIVAPGMIFLCVSGLTWSLVAGHNIAQVRTHLDWMAPPRTPPRSPPRRRRRASRPSRARRGATPWIRCWPWPARRA